MTLTSRFRSPSHTELHRGSEHKWFLNSVKQMQVSLVEEGVQRYCGSGRVVKECTPKSVAWPGLKPTPPPL